MQQQSTMNSRLVFLNAKQLLIKAGVSVANSKLTQSYLRLENQMLVGKTQFQFFLLTTQVNNAGLIFNTELCLNQQDSFVASSWGFFLGKPASNQDATFILRSYATPADFSTAGTAAAAQTVYNSFWQLAVNNDIIVPAADVYRHRSVPQTQFITFLPAATGPQTANEDQIDGSSEGFHPVEPNIVFVGSKNNVLNLLMPAAFAAVESFGRMTCFFRGVLAQNSTIIT